MRVDFLYIQLTSNYILYIMKKLFTSLQSLFVLLLLIFASVTFAQRPMEKLDRSVVAQKVSNGVYVNWRITSDEWYNTSYKLYRDGSLIFTATNTGASNYLDAAGTINSKYSVSSVRNGIESAQSAQASVLTRTYLEIPVRDIKSLGKTQYYLNDATTADLDGDGQYEIIVKRMNRDWSATNTNFTYFEAYKLDGTFMWAIDVGPNITMDVEINIAAFDFDGDGKAEVFMRSSDGTIFGLDKNNQNGTPVGDRNGDGYINYRQAPFNGIGGDGFMNAGPEYLSLIDGMTGKELDWANFIPRGTSGDWGDDYGHRANKFFFGAPYLDGKKPSLFIGRGIYTMHKMQTYDIVNKKLVKKWYWETTSWGQTFKGKWDDSPKSYMGQGYHNYTIADVDDDGKDEINWGSMSIDDDGLPLYSTELGHGDAQHYGDFDPYRKGQEMFACNETSPGTNLRDAKTGKMLYRRVAPSDVGRACAGNISDAYKGTEIWGNGVGLSATDRVEMNHFGVAENYCIYWDGDLLQELLDHSGFSTSTGVGYGAITKFNGYGNISTLLAADAYSCNYTKGTPCLQADIMGDWREEAIWWRSDSLALRVYTTPIVTNNRIYTLMHDHQYRQAICWQMCGYNQPPHTSFYLGSEFPTPIPAKSTNGKLIWNGASSDWNSSAANWLNGDDAAGLYAGTSTAINYADNKSLLFDTRATNTQVNIAANVSPEILTVSGSVDYVFSGSGSLTGAMKLDKMGEGTLSLNGNHTYSGTTDIWEGNCWLTGSLANSAIMVRRHANFGGKAIVNNGITTEFNAGIFVGGKENADTTTINGNLKLVEGARLYFDLSDNPTIPTGATGNGVLKNDLLILNGTLQISSGAIINVNQTSTTINPGKYLLIKGCEITGNTASMKIVGATGVATELLYDNVNKELYLVVKGVRSASKITWTGKTDSNWNLAKTANWDKEGYADIFVANDSVYLNETATNRTLNLVDSLPVAYLDVNSNMAFTIAGTGVLTGNMNLRKAGTGSLTINTRNNFSGKTVVEAGSLILKYAPSGTNNGGIGTNSTSPANFVVKDSSIVQITTANESTDRGLTLSGTAGGLLNVSATLYWNGIITGTKLTKYGAGTLHITNNNSTLNETVLKTGTIKIGDGAAVPYGVGKKLTMLGGTLETLNSTGAYLVSSHAIDVPEGATGTVVAGARCDYNGVLTGAGTLNWVTDYIRAYINANWSAFSGKINITANGANSTYENKFIVNTSLGFPNATVNIGSGVIMCYKNGTADNGTTTIKMGMLTGVAGSSIYNAGLEVGANNGSGTFAGIISGGTNIKKVGTGLLILSGANTYTGTTTVTQGTLTLSGTTSTGTLMVQNEGTMNLAGTAAGSASITSGGALNLNGTLNGNLSNTAGTIRGTGTVKGSVVMGSNSVIEPGNFSMGTFNIGGYLTLNNSSTIEMQVSATTNSSDRIVITGALNTNGVLSVKMLTGTPAAGREYQLFTAGSITGTFTTINLPTLAQGTEWDLSELYTTGKIKVIESTALNIPSFSATILQNPTSGLFRLSTDKVLNNLQVVVYNMQGKMVYQSLVDEILRDYEIDLTAQTDGIYLLKLYAPNEHAEMIKLIKK